MTDDPYEELGVPRDADDKAIKKAYRRRSKETHPDAESGSDEAFVRTNRALAILIDPKRRAKFDAGEEDDPEKTKNQKIRAVLGEHFYKLMAAFVNPPQGKPRGVDPRTIDLVAYLDEAVRIDIRKIQIGIDNGDGVAEVHEDILKRISGGPPGDPLGVVISEVLREGRKAREMLVDQLETLNLALAAIQQYKYRVERPPPSSFIMPSMEFVTRW